MYYLMYYQCLVCSRIYDYEEEQDFNLLPVLCPHCGNIMTITEGEYDTEEYESITHDLLS